jgi:hypothetical protein
MGDGRVNITWFLIRGSGIAAYALLAAATVWGLLVSTKLLGRAVKAKGLTWFHESLGLAAVIATGIHLCGLVADDYVHFGPADLFVPGASSWRPLAVAFGITAFYGLVVVAGSFYVKQWIGQRSWRAIHFLSFGCFVAATAHGIMAGSDVGNGYVVAMYAGGSAAVGLLLVVRVVQSAVAATPRRIAGAAVPSGLSRGDS